MDSAVGFACEADTSGPSFWALTELYCYLIVEARRIHAIVRLINLGLLLPYSHLFQPQDMHIRQPSWKITGVLQSGHLRAG